MQALLNFQKRRRSEIEFHRETPSIDEQLDSDDSKSADSNSSVASSFKEVTINSENGARLLKKFLKEISRELGTSNVNLSSFDGKKTSVDLEIATENAMFNLMKGKIKT